MRRLWAIGLLLLPALALAEEPDASALLQRAQTQFADGAIAEAEATLQAAAARTDRPPLLARIHLQLGLVQATRGQQGRARDSFRRALAHDPTLALDPHRDRPDLVTLFEAVRRTTVAEARISTRVPGQGEVWVDGERACRAPCLRRLAAGRHWLELRDPGGRRLDGRSVLLGAGPTSIVLGASALAEPAPPVLRSTGPATPIDRPPAPRRRVWTWIAGAAALASGAAALGLGLAARQDHEDGCGLLAGPAACEQRTALLDPASRERYLALGDSMDRKALAANLCWGVAGGLAVTAVVLFFVEGRGGKAAARTPGVRAGASGAWVHLSY